MLEGRVDTGGRTAEVIWWESEGVFSDHRDAPGFEVVVSVAALTLASSEVVCKDLVHTVMGPMPVVSLHKSLSCRPRHHTQELQ